MQEVMGLRFTTLEQDRVRSLLYASCLLSTRKGIDWRQRSEILAKLPALDSSVPAEAKLQLQSALDEAWGDLGPFRFSRQTHNDAVERVHRWIDRGISVIHCEQSTCADTGSEGLPPLLFIAGDPSLLSRPVAAILNSRKQRRVTPDDRWIRATKMLVRLACREDFVIGTSYGALHYDLLTFMVSERGTPAILVCDREIPFMGTDEHARRFTDTYSGLFSTDRNLLLSPFPPGSMPGRAQRSVTRDWIACLLSSHVFVGEIRERGNMDVLAKWAVTAGIPLTVFNPHTADERTSGNVKILTHSAGANVRSVSLDRKDRTKEQPSHHSSNRQRAPFHLRVVLTTLTDHEYLIHYTRSCLGPWPGQTLSQYCSSLVHGEPDAAHTAFDTLRRILTEKLLRASHRLIRGTTPVVSLTELSPLKMLRLMRWRTGLINWSYEPYGLAIRKRILVELGAEPVTYGTEKTYDLLPPERKHLFQLATGNDKDWSQEREWRLAGDLDLRCVPPDSLVVILPHLEEAVQIREEFGLPVTMGGVPESMIER